MNKHSWQGAFFIQNFSMRGELKHDYRRDETFSEYM